MARPGSDRCFATPSLATEQWWRVEGVSRLDCVPITDRLVVTVQAGARALAPVSDWYPQRSQLVRTLEAARTLADGKRWAALLISDAPPADGAEEAVARALPAAAPQLDAVGREELQRAFLGNLTWVAAAEAVAR